MRVTINPDKPEKRITIESTESRSPEGLLEERGLDPDETNYSVEKSIEERLLDLEDDP